MINLPDENLRHAHSAEIGRDFPISTARTGGTATGVRAHLGRVRLGWESSDGPGPYGGRICRWHEPIYDTPRRGRHGPAPLRLAMLRYAVAGSAVIEIG
jgi:hypothetical protein